MRKYTRITPWTCPTHTEIHERKCLPFFCLSRHPALEFLFVLSRASFFSFLFFLCRRSQILFLALDPLIMLSVCNAAFEWVTRIADLGQAETLADIGAQPASPYRAVTLTPTLLWDPGELRRSPKVCLLSVIHSIGNKTMQHSSITGQVHFASEFLRKRRIKRKKHQMTLVLQARGMYN